MPTTSNFGWTTPADTDLVKDGASAIRTLGNGIDTSLVDLKGGTTGQILSKASNTDLDYTWINNDQGDITAVTAGTGISGGGTTGAVTITNSMATTIDAKGDLIGGTGNDTFARLAVGNNGETLVADSSTTTGLRWQGDWNVGKNKVINGDFSIWQRGTSFSPANNDYTADRWQVLFDGSGATRTLSQQSFTPGTAPVAGYESQFFYRWNQSVAGTAGTFNVLSTKMEDVRTFAGQTVTVSFWAKAAASTAMGNIVLTQIFGGGGSANVGTGVTGSTFTTSWTRYSYQISVPSISGKTIGTNSSLRLEISMPLNTTFTVDIWGVQVEAGSVATSFTTNTANPQAELAACQRYYFRVKAAATNVVIASGVCNSTTSADIFTPFPVVMRTAPTALEQTGTATDYQMKFANLTQTCSAVPTFSSASVWGASTAASTSGSMTAGFGSFLRAATTSAYLGWSAEL